MPIYVKCNGCGRVLIAPDGCEGRTIQCVTCGKRMRVPKQAPPAPAEPARPAAAPPPPTPAAPVSESVTGDHDAFFRALAEETAREQRAAAAAKAAKAEAEAQLTPLSEALAGGPPAGDKESPIKPAAGESGHIPAESTAPPKPAAPPSATPARSGMPEDKDAFFSMLAKQAALEQSETGAAKAAKTEAEAGLPPSPEAIARGRSSAATELRIKTVADKSGYAVAAGSEPPPTGPEKRPRPMRKLAGAAVGLALLILLIVALYAGLSSSRSGSGGRKTAKEEPVANAQKAVAPEAIPAPAMPPAMKEAAQALADKAVVEVEVVETAPDAAAAQMPLLTPTGDLMLDLTNVHIRDKSAADVSLEEMRSASRAAVYESVAARLREKGLTPVEAGQSAAGSAEEPRSRLKVFISTAPAWAGFNFRESQLGNDNAPSQPAPPPRFMPPPRGRPRRTQFTSSGRPAPPTNPVKLWERLISGDLSVSAQFNGDPTQHWFATASDDAQADRLPCGLRISIVRLVWEVGERSHDLIGRSAEADATFSGNDAEPGAALPFHRPKQLREMQLTGQMGPDRTCLISGFCQYDDVDLHDGAADAGKLAAGPLAAPEAEWNTFWEGKADKDSMAAACRNILRLDGGPAMAEALAAKPDRLPRSSAAALASALKDEHGNPEWAVPFLAVRGACADAALIGLARQPKEENQKDFLQCIEAPADHSAQSVQAACCALIDLGRPDSKVNALIDTQAVKAFFEVRSPRGSLAFPPQTAETVLDWLIREGTPSQRVGAAAAAVEGNVEELQDAVRAFVSQSLGSDPTMLCRLCKGIEKSQSPLAFEILSSVAQRQLMRGDAGDRFLPPAALSDTGAPLPAGRYSRTVAALVCAGLARFDKFEAGKVLMRLIQSPGSATRYCAIETLIALDDVDAAPDIRARFDLLSKQARNPYEAQEWELLSPFKNKLCRYDVPLISAENALKNRINPQEVIETCDGIINDNPSPTLVERAREMKRRAEKLLEVKGSPPH